MVATAADHGLILSGQPDPGWDGLDVTGATLAGLPSLPTASVGRLTLHRSIRNLFRLSVAIDRPMALLFPDGRQIDLWSTSFRFVEAGRKWDFDGTGVGVGRHGDGPDDVTAIEDLAGDGAEASASWRVDATAR